uniref:Uncharacterized protein n=1 Tax=Rhizophora mucronata TaxID=61149 RepID=A0A2P2QBD8_RHIMU
MIENWFFPVWGLCFVYWELFLSI